MYHGLFVTVPLLDLKAQYTPIREALLEAVTRVCDSQRFIGGVKSDSRIHVRPLPGSPAINGESPLVACIR